VAVRPSPAELAEDGSEVTTVIRPSRGWVPPNLRELWQYRELVYFLIWRNIKVRYKQTTLGIAWAILQPVATMLVFSLFFGKLAEMPSVGLPYPMFALAALVPWTFFANGLTQSASSVVSDEQLIRKVYFPRLAIPVSTVLSGVVDFLLAFAVLLAMLPFYGVLPSANVVWLPLLLVLAFVTTMGVGLWLSALNVRYRDVRHAVPFLTQFWLFATPIAYPSSLVPENWRALYGVNPMVGVVDGFRWALLGVDTQPGPMIAVSTVTALVILVGGVLYFRGMERHFADIV
jgi:lipopolysaccharide transport system permease protein